MSKSLAFSNGQLYVSLDKTGLVRDFYFPYIGLEHHSSGLKHRIGFWVDGSISWIDSSDWTHKARYPQDSLVGLTVAVNKNIGLLVEFEDFVDAKTNSFVRNIHMVNLKEDKREIRLFTHQAFNISNNNLDDSAYYLPGSQSCLHYNGRRVFMAGGVTDSGESADQYCVGNFGGGLDGTWRDAEDGSLSNSKAAQGQTDSTLRFSLEMGALSSRRVHYWVCAAESIGSAKHSINSLRRNGVFSHLNDTFLAWKKWLSPAYKAASLLDPKYRLAFIQSIMKIRSRIDARGSVITSFRGADYGFMTPAQSAYAIWPLIRLGYQEEALRFFEFCETALADEGYLAVGYQADGGVTSTQLPFEDSNSPVFIDQTALVTFVFTQMHIFGKSTKVLKDFYSNFLVPSANYLVKFSDEKGFLKPNIDLDNADRSPLTTYSVSVIYAALMASADIAESAKDQDSAVKWRTFAEEMRRSALPLIASDGILIDMQGSTKSSVAAFFGAFMYGLINTDSDLIKHTLQVLEEKLLVDDGLFAFSETDRRVDYVGSLWMAQYYLEAEKYEEASRIIKSVMDHTARGVVDQSNSLPVYAEIVSTLLDTMTRK